jgi:hypothetical protein
LTPALRGTAAALLLVSLSAVPLLGLLPSLGDADALLVGVPGVLGFLLLAASDPDVRGRP